MDALRSLFERKAQVFTDGDISALGRTLKTPTALYFGDRLLPMPHEDAVNDLMFAYRAELVEKGFDHTTFEILETKSDKPGCAVAKVRWSNRDRNDAEISTWTGTYFCEQSGQDWRVTMVDVLDLHQSTLRLAKTLVPDG